ncbi:MAG: hypothetical protein J0H53_05460 [Rhizobiales bacterium]|nr:hypothetical protein [Hyphomicrobiales bacterium]
MAEFSELSGRWAADLGNAISDAIHAALLRGMETDEAACIAVSVAADYARAEYGDAYLQDLAKVVVMRAGRPMPEDAST